MLPIQPADVCAVSTPAIVGAPASIRIGDGNLHCVEMFIDTGRWAGVPFLLRTGKRPGRRAENHFDRVPTSRPRACFPPTQAWVPQGRPPDIRPGGCLEDVVIVLRQAPGSRDAARQTQPAVRDARHRFLGGLPEAYERWYLDAMRGDHTLFNTAGESSAVGGFNTVAGSPTAVRLYAPGRGVNAIHPARRPSGAGACRLSVLWRDPNKLAASPGQLIPSTTLSP